MIGVVGTILGEAQVSISSMAVGPSASGNTALMVLSTDLQVPDDALAHLRGPRESATCTPSSRSDGQAESQSDTRRSSSVADAHSVKPFAEGQMMTVFRSRRRDGSEEAYHEVSEAMKAAARSVPGFVDFKTFTSEDGEHVSLVTFASPESHQVWRNDSDIAGPRSRAGGLLRRVLHSGGGVHPRGSVEPRWRLTCTVWPFPSRHPRNRQVP